MAARKYDHLFQKDIHYQNIYPPQKAMMFYGLDEGDNHFQIRFTHVSQRRGSNKGMDLPRYQKPWPGPIGK